MFKTLVTHDNCSDGLASALIVADALPGIEVIFAQHNTASLTQLQAKPGMLFCDIVPPAARVQEFVDAGAVVLDHHKHARDIVEQFGDRGRFADEDDMPGVSGALLAFHDVWCCVRSQSNQGAGRWDDDRVDLIHHFAKLIGVRDTWRTASALWEQANELHAVLMGLPRDYWIGHLDRVLDNEVYELGRLFRAQRLQKADEAIATSLIRLGDGTHHWAVFPDGRHLISDVAEKLRQSGDASVVCGWFQTVEAGVVSTVLTLRSDGSVDVGALAKRFGGGGHSRAAGCAMRGEPNSLKAVGVLLQSLNKAPCP